MGPPTDTASSDAELLKEAAVTCWTADPCGSSVSSGEQGTRAYFERLLEARRRYAPWMDEELDYEGTAGLRVLDVGCGQGIDLARYAMGGADVTGVDLTPRHVELARLHLHALGLRGEVREGDAEALPFPDASFERVTSNGVLHHTPNMPAALREIRRVLAPGGETRVIVYNRNSFHYWLTQVLWQGLARGWLVKERSMSGVLSRGVEFSSVGARPLVRVYAPKQVARLLDEAGFERVTTVVRHFNVSDTPVTHALSRLPALRNPRLLDRIGRIGGWYIVGSGFRPPA